MTDLDSRTVGAPPPGWYPDALGQTRWWDGAAWTGHVAEEAATPTVHEVAPATAAGPVVAAPVQPTASPMAPLPEGPVDEVFANDFEALVARRAEAAAAEEAAALPTSTAPTQPAEPDIAMPPPIVPSGHVTPSRAAGIEGPSRKGSVVLLVVAVPLMLWAVFSLLAVVLRGTDALGPIRTPLALLLAIVGGWVIAKAVVALQRGERAELPDAVVDGAEAVADADRRVLALVGLAVVVVAASYAVAPLLEQEPAPVAPVAAEAVAAPKGFTAVADEVAYRLLPASTKGCTKGSTCRTVEVVALVPCAEVSAVVVFRDRFGGGLGTALVGTSEAKVGKPVALKASVRDTSATQASVASIRCRAADGS